LGAGAIQPIAWTIIGDIYPPAERGKMQGWLSSVFGTSALVGPALGGAAMDLWNPQGLLAALALLFAAFSAATLARRNRVAEQKSIAP